MAENNLHPEVSSSLLEKTPQLDSPLDEKNKKTILQKFLRYRGVYFALISSMFAALSSVLVKECYYLNASDQALVRYTLQFLVMILIACKNNESLLGEKEQRKFLIMRGAIGTIGMIFITFSLKLIDPSDTIALLNCSIILISILSRIFLKEKFTIAHLIAIALTVNGVLLISQPTFLVKRPPSLNLNFTNLTNSFTNEIPTTRRILGIIVAIIGTIAASVVSVLLKQLANKKVHYSVAIIYATYFGLPLCLALSLGAYFSGLDTKKPIEFTALVIQICLALGSAITGLSAQAFLNLSYNHEDASKISLVKSADLIFIFFFQYILLDIRSNVYSISGAVLILIGVSIVMIYKILDQKYTKKHKVYLNSKSNKSIPVEELDNMKKPTLFKRILFYKF